MSAPAPRTSSNTALPPDGLLGRIGGWLETINRWAVRLSMLALLAAAMVLTYSVVSRHGFGQATDWEDEFAVFALVGATFLCGAWVQSQRGHLGIEALAAVLPPVVNRARVLATEVGSFLFCAFFSWKSWALFREAVAEHQTTASSWGPPLAVPYAFMAAGMTLLTLQLLLQVVAGFARPRAVA